MSTIANTLHPNARQCAYIKVDGIQCGSPAWQENRHCHHHHGLKQRFEEKKISIPPLDDANSVQVAVMDVLNGLLRGTVTRPDAYTLLYGIQVAKSNLKGITLVPPSPDLIAEAIAAARAEARAEVEKLHADEAPSLAEHLLRCLGEDSDAAGQAHINDILIKQGKAPCVPRAERDAKYTPNNPSPPFEPSADFDSTASLAFGYPTRTDKERAE